jgi:hypothetical protein
MSVYDYDSVWGNTEKNWRPVDFRKSQICIAMLVVSWMGMVSSFVFVVLAVVSRSDLASILMIASMLVWLTGGIAYIRVRRNMRKYIKVIQ